MVRYSTVTIFFFLSKLLYDDELKNKQSICWMTVDYRVEPKLRRNAKHASSFMLNVS